MMKIHLYKTDFEFISIGCYHLPLLKTDKPQKSGAYLLNTMGATDRRDWHARDPQIYLHFIFLMITD